MSLNPMDGTLSGPPNPLDERLAEQVLAVTEVLEQRVDEAIDSLDNIERIRERRLAQLRQRAEKNKEFLELGHGDYREIEERDIFRILTRSSLVFVHFSNDSDNCRILDGHLTKLSGKHLEARFLKLNAEKSPFLCGRLKVTVLPTCLSIRNSQVIDRLIGFTELGNTNQFSTETLEAYLVQKNFLVPSEDMEDGQTERRKKLHYLPKQTNGIRSGQNTGEDW